MRTPIYIVLLAALFACDSDDPVVKHKLAIDVQSDFTKDRVEISVDDNKILDKVLETNHLLGVCSDGRTSLELTKGNHTVAVRINNTIQKTQSFLLQNNTLYLGVSYIRDTDEVILNFSLEPFAYD